MRITILALALLAQSAGPIFRFEADGFWLKLHHFLYVLGGAQNQAPDSRRSAVVNATVEQEAPYLDGNGTLDAALVGLLES